VLRERRESRNETGWSLSTFLILFISSFTRITSITWLETKGKEYPKRAKKSSHVSVSSSETKEMNESPKRETLSWFISSSHSVLISFCLTALVSFQVREKKNKKDGKRELETISN
jgi:hypothetical protein